MPFSFPSHNNASSPSRREFLKRGTASLATGFVALTGCSWMSDQHDAGRPFQSHWPDGITRTWIGPRFWSNPLQDWQIANGRLELVAPGQDRKVHLLTHSVDELEGSLALEVTTEFSTANDESAAGFEVGIEGPLQEYRHNVFEGNGLRAGLDASGALFIGDASQTSDKLSGHGGAVRLELTASQTEANGPYSLTLSAVNPDNDEVLGTFDRTGLPATTLRGNLALFADSGTAPDTYSDRGETQLWFSNWRASGSALTYHPDRRFGPVLFVQYTLSRNTLNLTAQMPPVGTDEAQTVELQIREGDNWTTVAEESIHNLARTATFQVPKWNSTVDTSYRLVYPLTHSDRTRTYTYHGTIRKDPIDQNELVVGGLSCQTDSGFPHQHIADGLQQHDPDLLAFTGDQFYEGSGGYGYIRDRDAPVELSTLDYLRKWYMYGWAFGELTRNRPTVCMPDDHDVYHGNIWGEGGKAAMTYEEHNNGGYYMPAEWVNMVQRTQTSHLPDPYDPTPVKQDITVYYTDLVYGRISFAIVEDRKWKTGPDGLIPNEPERPDHVVDPDRDPATLDVPEAELLGPRQLEFLDEWASDWRHADMKSVISQSLFAQVPNIHGRGKKVLAADLDSNGWPQTPRDQALRRFRKGYAFHIGGDQHLPMIVHYGIDEWDDAGYNFSVPAISAGYPRAFRPEKPGRNHKEGMPPYTGQYYDGLDNLVTVHAVANPRSTPREGTIQRLIDKSSGYGIIRFNKPERSITIEAWPLASNPAEGDDQQFTGWPKTVDMQDNFGRSPQAYLPTISVDGLDNPMFQVVDDETGEVQYTIRPGEQQFRPKVFASRPHSVRIGNDEEWLETLDGLPPVPPESDEVRSVSI